MLRLALLALLLPAAAQAQTVFLGTAVDAETGETLPGATAQIAGTTTGAASAADGTFRLTLEALPATVIVRFLGYAPAQTVVTPGDVRVGPVRDGDVLEATGRGAADLPALRVTARAEA